MLCFQRDFQDKTSSLSRLILLSDYQTAFKLPSESSMGFDRFSLNECQHSTSPATWTSHQTKHTRTELTEQRHSRQGSLLEGNFCPSANTLDSYSHCSHLQDWKFLEIFLLYWKNLQRPHVILYLVFKEGVGLMQVWNWNEWGYEGWLPWATVSSAMHRVSTRQGGTGEGWTSHITILEENIHAKDKL